MGRTRQPQPDAQSPRSRSDAAADIAAYLLAAQATETGLAVLLLPVLPRDFVLATPDLAARVAQEAATLVLTNPPVFRPQAGEFERRASFENILKRGFYAIAAVRRLSEAVSGSSDDSDTPVADRLTKALRREQSHLTAHLNAGAQRLEGAKRTDRARELHGDVVSWQHGVHGHPMEPRPAHVAADGKTWDLRRGVPLSTGSLPNTLPGCTCDWGPAKAGAQELR